MLASACQSCRNSDLRATGVSRVAVGHSAQYTGLRVFPKVKGTWEKLVQFYEILALNLDHSKIGSVQKSLCSLTLHSMYRMKNQSEERFCSSQIKRQSSRHRSEPVLLSRNIPREDQDRNNNSVSPLIYEKWQNDTQPEQIRPFRWRGNEILMILIPWAILGIA